MKFQSTLIFILAEYNAPWEHDTEKWSFCEKVLASEKMETELHNYDKIFEPLESSNNDNDDDDDDDDDTNHYLDMIDHELINGEYMKNGISVLKSSQPYLKLNQSTIEGINDLYKNDNDSTSDSDEDYYVEPYAHIQKSKEHGVLKFDEANIHKGREVTNNERIQPKPDVLIREKKLPKIPWRTNALKQENNGPMQPKKSPEKTLVPAMIPPPVKRNQNPKPLQKPRQKTVGNLESFCKDDFNQDQDKPSGNVRSLAHQLQNKIKPVPSPNITQAKLKQIEYTSEYIYKDTFRTQSDIKDRAFSENS